MCRKETRLLSPLCGRPLSVQHGLSGLSQHNNPHKFKSKLVVLTVAILAVPHTEPWEVQHWGSWSKPRWSTSSLSWKLLSQLRLASYLWLRFKYNQIFNHKIIHIYSSDLHDRWCVQFVFVIYLFFLSCGPDCKSSSQSGIIKGIKWSEFGHSCHGWLCWLNGAGSKSKRT